MSKTIKLTEARRDVLRNALSAEITSLYAIVEDEAETTKDRAHYGKQLKVAVELLKLVQ